MEPSDSRQTVRQQIIDLLSSEESTVRDISQALRIPEKEAIDHLSHIEHSVKRLGKKLEITPYRCLSCGFAFDNRSRFTKPGRCPKCKKSHLQTAYYRIK